MHLVKRFIAGFIVLGVLAVVIWQAVAFISEQSKPHTDVTLRGTVFTARLALDQQARDKGLSGTKSLGKNEALLFAFAKDDTWGIWMKDMAIPIDIIWLDANKEVVFIVKDADPSSYPYTTYRPPKPARYVLEVAAGTVESKQIRSGDKALFDISAFEENIQ